MTGKLSPRAYTRILFMEGKTAVQPDPKQTFYLSSLEKKYTSFTFLKKANLDPKIAYEVKTSVLNYNTLKNLNLIPKKFFIDNIEKNINLTKQNK
jgi:hypothetical protein